MPEKPRTWHEVLEEKPESELPFLELYREYAEELRRRASEKAAAPYWPWR